MVSSKWKGCAKIFPPIVVGLLVSMGALGAPTATFNGSGLLTGFTGLTVGSSLYNVQFVDGVYTSVFPSGPAFNDTTAAAAATAIYGMFAPQNATGLVIAPSSIFGCNDVAGTIDACLIWTPDTFTAPAGFVDVTEMRHGDVSVGGVVQDGISVFPISTSIDTTNLAGLADGAVWAVWTPAATTVPEPATLALLGVGLAGLGFSRRKRATR